jgi:hypothetical protein
VTARLNSPSLGAASYLEKGKWSGGISYRWQKSDRHFIGDEEQTIREKEGSQVINNVSLVDVGVTYAFTDRITASLGIPFQFATRSQTIRDTRPGMTNEFGRQKIYDRFQTEANGLGDIRLMFSSWIFNPKEFKRGNISLGLGVLFPTGQEDAKDEFEVFDTNSVGFIRSEQRNVDNSIQPGAGVWGILFDTSMFIEPIRSLTNFTLYGAATYIATPAETAGVKSGSLSATNVWSTGDSYLVRGGMSYTILPKFALTVTLGGRLEGSPPEDIFGESGGRRRPGYAVSIEPGLVFVREGWSASISAPVALYRNRQPDSSGQEGDAAFADFMILASIGRVF